MEFFFLLMVPLLNIGSRSPEIWSRLLMWSFLFRWPIIGVRRPLYYFKWGTWTAHRLVSCTWCDWTAEVSVDRSYIKGGDNHIVCYSMQWDQFSQDGCQMVRPNCIWRRKVKEECGHLGNFWGKPKTNSADRKRWRVGMVDALYPTKRQMATMYMYFSSNLPYY